MKLVLLVCFLSAATGRAMGVYKRWVQDTNFENPSNWNAKRAPCGNDVVGIPDGSPTIYVQMNTTLKELILPKDGLIIFGNNVGFGFTETHSDSCQEFHGDLTFDVSQARAWMDPGNWCSSSTERGGGCLNSVLDTENVPCAYDDVIFPRDRLYYVNLTDNVRPTPIKSIKVSGQAFSSSSALTDYFNNVDIRKMFIQPTGGNPVDIRSRECRDIKGCACGNDRPEIVSKICSHVLSCRRPRCRETIKPVGACCKYCGVIFNITIGYGFEMSSFQTVFNQTKYQFGFRDQDINTTVSMTSEGWIQVVLTDLTGEKSVALAKRIKTDMDTDIKEGGHKYAIDAVQLSVSTGVVQDPGALTGYTDGAIAGIVFAGILGLVIIIAIIVLATFKKRGRTLSMPKMADMPTLPRFPRRAPKATARVLPGVFSQPHTAPHIDPGFANPLYDTSPFDDGNVVFKEMNLIGSPGDQQPTFDVSDRGFNNPLYGAQGTLYSDPSTADDAEEGTSSQRKIGVAVTPASGASLGPSKGGKLTVAVDHSSIDNDSTI